MIRDKGIRGFTLIEVLTVIVLIGIVSGVVMHGAGRVAPRLGVVQETARVTSEIARTRALAVAEQRIFRLRFRGGSRMRTYRRVDGRWRAVGPATRIRDVATVRIDGSAAGSVVFLPQGHVRAPATIEIIGADRREVISVLASGMTKRRLR